MANTADTTDRGHPIIAVLSRTADDLKSVRDAPAWSMTAEQTRTALVEATRLVAQLSELEARLAHHAQTVEVEADSGATSTANWWAHATRQTRPAAHRKTRLAAALGSEAFEPTGWGWRRVGCWSTRPRSSSPRSRRCRPTSTRRSRPMRR